MSTTPTNPAQSDQGMQERAATAADSARREAGSVMDDARSQARDVASAGPAPARPVVDDATHETPRPFAQQPQQLMIQVSRQHTSPDRLAQDARRQPPPVQQGAAQPHT